MIINFSKYITWIMEKFNKNCLMVRKKSYTNLGKTYVKIEKSMIKLMVRAIVNTVNRSGEGN